MDRCDRLALARHRLRCPLAYGRAAASDQQRKCQAILRGMTEKDVEEILDVPAGNYTTGPIAFLSKPVEMMPNSKCWASNDAVIDVHFDAHGKVVW